VPAVISLGQSRGSIPEELLRPARGEAPRYPVDIVIGTLGRGSASNAAYTYANSFAARLLSGSVDIPAVSEISVIQPLSYRIGGGRTEADGAVSFLVRFIGRNQAITGELYIRLFQGSWVFDEIILEAPKSREAEASEAVHRYDFYPYERFF